MGTEIERKYLVTDDSWRAGAKGTTMRQGYLHANAGLTVRVRTEGESAVLTIKKGIEGISRHEFEYEIPRDDAQFMLDNLCAGHIVEKTRHEVEFKGMTWEVDEFHGENAGLIVAEIELESEDQAFDRPPWLGQEVSDDPRYLNASLSRVPYSEW